MSVCVRTHEYVYIGPGLEGVASVPLFAPKQTSSEHECKIFSESSIPVFTPFLSYVPHVDAFAFQHPNARFFL